MKSSETPKKKRLIPLLIVLVIIIVIAAVIYFLHGDTSQQAGPSSAPASSVKVGTTSTANVPVTVKALGTLYANQTVDVTSRIDGQLTHVAFREGQYVEKGQLLAQVDTRSYEASKAQYQGELKENQANLTNARLTLARYRRLYAQDSLSRQDLDTQIATVGQYEGAVESDQAQIKAAEVDIDYGRITAPVSGYVGLRQVDVGNVVTADSTEIVELTQTSPIALKFSIPEKYLPSVRPVLRKGGTLPVSILGSDNSTHIASGKVQYLDNSIDTSTGTIELKALFPNQDENLFPNQYVNVELQIRVLENSVIAPAAAVQQSDSGNYVYVVDADDKVHKTTVTTGPNYSNDRIAILKGLKSGERLVTNGVDNLTEGGKVNPVSTSQDADQTSSSSSNNASQDSSQSSSHGAE